jgi:hypothetical protein
MTTTVNVVVVGMTATGRIAAIEAARCCKSVLVVDSTMKKSACHAFRHELNASAPDCHRRVSLQSGVEVVWIDGKRTVEVVLLRHIKSGRIIGINTGRVVVTTVVPAGIISPAIRDQVLSK